MTDTNERIQVLRADITSLAVDAIVNAANEAMRGGGGVDGAIHRAAGPELLEECIRVGRCPTGQARLTGGYRLPAKHVIHTVGPRWSGGTRGEESLLESCYRSCLTIARDNAFDTIAFPAISTGVYGYPADRAAQAAVRTVLSFLSTSILPAKVILVCFDPASEQACLSALAKSDVSSQNES